MTCKHEHGDHIKDTGMWVCGRCYEKLHERPKTYSMMVTNYDGIGQVGQQIVWQAEVLKSNEGITLNTFLKAMVRRFMSRASDLSKSDAYDIAIEALKFADAEFGDADFCWGRAGAIDIADEEMHYWDEEGAAGN